MIQESLEMMSQMDDAKDELRRIIRKGTKKEYAEKVIELEAYQKTQSGLGQMEKAKEYILSNYGAARRMGKI